MSRLRIMPAVLAATLAVNPADAPADLAEEALHAAVIQESALHATNGAASTEEAVVIRELFTVMDAFVRKDLETLAARVHPAIVELDSTSPYRAVGKANFLEHMSHFFGSPVEIKGHYVRIKEPLAQIYGGSSAVVTFLYDAEGAIGGSPVKKHGKASFVFVKDSSLPPDMRGVWLLALSHYSANAPAP